MSTGGKLRVNDRSRTLTILPFLLGCTGEEGDNEVWFAVTEAFGRWGLMASIADRAGIRVERPRTSSN